MSHDEPAELDDVAGEVAGEDEPSNVPIMIGLLALASAIVATVTRPSSEASRITLRDAKWARTKKRYSR